MHRPGRFFFLLGATAIGGKGSGRKPNADAPLRTGERTAIEALQRRIEDRSDTDPLVLWAMQRLIEIGGGACRRRHVGVELAAIRDILDRREGRPTEKVQHSGEIRHRVEIVDDADGEG